MELDKVTIQDHHEPDAGNECVVISHPLPPAPAHINSPPPKHVHDGREVICKAGTNDITLEPMLSYPTRHSYKRTDQKDYMGRAIFTEAK